MIINEMPDSSTKSGIADIVLNRAQTAIGQMNLHNRDWHRNGTKMTIRLDPAAYPKLGIKNGPKTVVVIPGGSIAEMRVINDNTKNSVSIPITATPRNDVRMLVAALLTI